MSHEKVYKRRAKEGMQQYSNQCCWVPGTPVKERHVSKAKGCSYRTGFVDLNKNIVDAESEAVPVPVPEVLGFSVSVDLNKGFDVDYGKEVQFVAVGTPASQESANLSLVFDSGKEPETECKSKNFLLPSSDHTRILCPDSKIDGYTKERDSGNYLLGLLPNWDDANDVKNLRSATNSPESCLLQSVQQNVGEEVVVQEEEDEVSGMEVENLKKALKRRPQQKPKRKKIRPRVVVDGKRKKTPQKSPEPKKAPQPKTPKPANETTRKRKYGRKNVEQNFVSGDVVDESVYKKRKCARGNSKNKWNSIIELPHLPFRSKSCRQALNFYLESRDDKAIATFPECRVQVDECAIPECGVQVDECDVTKAIPECEEQVDECVDITKTLFMRSLPLLQVEYPRGRRSSRRATRRCSIRPRLPSKQAVPGKNAIPICSQPPKHPSKQADPTEKGEAEIIYEPEACKNMLLTNNIERNVAGRTEIESCVLEDNKNEGSPLKYEVFPLTSYLTGIDSQDSIIRKHPLELENFGLMDQTIGSQNVMQEPHVHLQEGFLQQTEFSQEFLHEQRMGALPLFLERRSNSPSPFLGQSSGVLAPFSGRSIGALELLAQQNVGVLGLFPEQNAVEPFLDQSNGALEHFVRQAINSQEMHSPEFLKEQVMYHLECLQEQIIGPCSRQVLQDKNLVNQRKDLNPEDLWLPAKSRGSQGVIQAGRIHVPTQKRSPRRSREIIRKFEALSIRDGGSRLMQQDNKAYGLSSGHGAVVPFVGQSSGHGAVVPFVGQSSGHGAVIPYQVKEKRKKLRPEVDLDPRTLRIWNLIMNIDDGTSKDQRIDQDMEKWWEKEREVFGGRIQSFTARMHLILGDRRFKPWKGSVVDSVVGVYLTQNVSDNLSSSAYMSLAARFPLKSRRNHSESDKNLTITANQESVGRNSTSNAAVYDSERIMYFVTEPEPDRCCELKDRVNPFDSRIQGKSLLETEDMRLKKDAVASQAFDTSSVKSLDRTQLFPAGNSKTDVAFSNKTCSTESSIAQLSLTGNLKANVASPSKTCTAGSSFSHLSPAGNLKADVASLSKTCNAEISITQFSPTQNLKADVVSPTKTCSVECSITQLSPSENSKAEVASPSKSCSPESSITASKENLQLENTTLLQLLHDKVDGVVFCDECLDGYTTPTRMDNGSKGSSRTDMLQARDAAPMRKKSPKGKGPKLKEYKSDMKTDGTKRTAPKKDDNQEQRDWDLLRRTYSNGVERSSDQMDSVDWEAVRCAEVSEIADAIKERGQQNIIAGRIKDFLNRMVELHSCIDLEWLRNVPPDNVKKYLLDIQGLGLKSVECVRLLSLQHVAFPVDVNVGRIAVRLGWVPLQPLPGNLHIHLLEEYPVMDTIQKYLWPRLCYLDQKTLYELHYQMITFGKVFCKKRNPNCGACPLRGECKHFASAFASARLGIAGPSEKGIVKSDIGNGIGGNPPWVVNPMGLPVETDLTSESGCQINNFEPIIEEPQSPEPQFSESPEPEIEDDFNIGDIEDIPTIRLQERDFKENVQNFVEMNKIVLQDSSALALLTAEAASMPARKLKEYAHLRTDHMVYVLPDNHELLQGFEGRDPDDPSPYLLAIWYPGDTPNSVVPLLFRCSCKESELCNSQICYACNCTREKNAGIVRGTILIPCRTANRGRFPLNGTYFQVNEVFADHETSYRPINVPRHMIANLPTQTACFGSSATSIFNALHLRGIQECFWKGFVCVRGFDRRYRCPRPLTKRFHCPPRKMEAGTKRTRDEKHE